MNNVCCRIQRLDSADDGIKFSLTDAIDFADDDYICELDLLDQQTGEYDHLHHLPLHRAVPADLHLINDPAD